MNWNKLKKQAPAKQQILLEQIAAFNAPDAKVMVHVRIDPNTAMLLKQFKLATDIELQQLLAFAIDEFVHLHPELKTIVKQFLQEFNE
jgi:hypothetical protein